MRLHIGVTHIEIRSPLDVPLKRLVRERPRENGVVYPPATSRWLFPSIDPGEPLSAAPVGARLRRLGSELAGVRPTAMSHLAAGLPTAAATWMLDVSPHTAVR
jgi:hypothetical protein